MSMYIRQIHILIFSLISITHVANAMISDNRFLPFIYHQPVTIEDQPSIYRINVFAMTGNRAFGPHEDEIGIPELYGMYDLKDINKGLAAVGKSVDLSEELFFKAGTDFPFAVNGKIQAQGVEFYIYQALTRHFIIGASWSCLRLDSYQIFSCPGRVFSEDEKRQLEEGRLAMNRALGLTGPHAHEVGFGDLDAFIRLGNQWEYMYKFRMIDAGVRFGMYAPVGQTRRPNNPASLPIGGNGHWGLYAQGDLELELKEDLTVGLMTRFIKRHKRINCERMPVGNEPYIFGPVVGPVLIDPGFTYLIQPYLCGENLREGFGMMGQLTWIKHECDQWDDARSDKTVKVNLANPMGKSAWSEQYLTLQLFYDFGKMKTRRELDPILFFAWDIPLAFFGPENACQTNKVSLGIEITF